MSPKSLCIIPARGGSKGIKKKNIAKLGDFTILARTIIQAKESKVFDYIHVSTDSLDIQKEALKFNASCEFLRPLELSNDSIGTSECILHSIKELEKKGNYFDYVYELQPTYVFRSKNLIQQVGKIINKSISICTVKKIESTAHPDFYCTIASNKNLSFGKYLPDKFARQKVRECYAVVGIVLASDIELFKKERSFFNKKSFPYIVKNNIELFDINTEEDLKIANNILLTLSN